MSMVEPTPAAKPATKPRRRKKRAAATAAKPKAPPLFARLTANDCCGGCKAEACVISGKPYCAHPFKGGLQGRDMANDEAVKRMEWAKKMLGKAKVKLDGL